MEKVNLEGLEGLGLEEFKEEIRKRTSHLQESDFMSLTIIRIREERAIMEEDLKTFPLSEESKVLVQNSLFGLDLLINALEQMVERDVKKLPIVLLSIITVYMLFPGKFDAFANNLVKEATSLCTK